MWRHRMAETCTRPGTEPQEQQHAVQSFWRLVPASVATRRQPCPSHALGATAKGSAAAPLAYNPSAPDSSPPMSAFRTSVTSDSWDSSTPDSFTYLLMRGDTVKPAACAGGGGGEEGAQAPRGGSPCACQAHQPRAFYPRACKLATCCRQAAWGQRTHCSQHQTN